MLSPGNKRNLIKILTFGLISLLFSSLYVLIERGILGNADIYPSTQNPYDFRIAVVAAPIGGMFMGLIAGVLEVFVVGHVFRTSRFVQKVLLKTVVYVLVIVLMLVLIGFFGNSIRLGTNPLSEQVLATVWAFISNFVFLSIVIYASIMLAFAVFLVEVSDRLGLSMFQDFVTGRYQEPKEEERIFMFLDMKSSTTIAEELGHKNYYELLNQYYADINDVILDTLGEIYQYVGDEVVVSWTIKNGLLNQNCFKCFFMVKKLFEEKREWYLHRFGVVPDFKAGLHFGIVTVGEVGVIKKELLFTGDVLNTTARIRESCSQFGSDIIISRHLLERMKPLPADYTAKEIGETQLRGKKISIRLFTIETLSA